MDLSKLSTEDLLALKDGDLSKVSTDGLKKLAGYRSSTIGEDLYSGAMSAARTATIGGGLVMSNLLPDGSLKDQLFENMDKAAEAFKKKAELPPKVEQSFVGKLFGVLPQIPAMPFAPADTGVTMLEKGETLDNAISATLLDTLGNTAGVALPAGLGGKLATRVATGAGMGAAQDAATRQAITSVAETPEAKEYFKPTWETTALAGVVGGAVGMLPRARNEQEVQTDPGSTTPTPLGFKSEPTPEEARAYMEKQMDKEPQAIRNDIFETHEKAFVSEQYVERLRTNLDELNYELKALPEDSPRAAGLYDKIGKTEEKLAKAEAKVADYNRRIALNEQSYTQNSKARGQTIQSALEMAEAYKAKAIEAGDTLAIRRAEIVIGREKQRLAREGIQQEVSPAKEAPIKQEELPVTKESVADAQQAVKQDSIKIQEPLTIEQARQEYAANQAELKALYDLKEEKANPVLDARIKELETKNNNLISKFRTDKDAPVEDHLPYTREPSPGLKVKNATAEEAQLVQDIAEKLGLTKDDIEIDLQAESSRVHYTDTGYDVSISRNPTQQPSLVTERAKRFWASLKGEDAARFEKAWSIAHELGHITLNKLLRNSIYDGKINKIVDEYADWVRKNPTQARQTGSILPSRDAVAQIRDPEYFIRFPEFFAQRVAREFSYKTDTPIGKFVSDVEAIWKSVVKHFTMGVRAVPIVDDLIRSIIRQNEESVAKTGQTIWDIHTVNETRTPLEAAKLQEELFGYSIKSDYDLAVPPRNPLANSAGAVIHEVEQVIEQYKNYSDIQATSSSLGREIIGVIGRKVGNSILPLLQKAGLSDNPVIKYAVNVIYEESQKTHKIQHEILAGKAQVSEHRGILPDTRRLADPKSFQQLSTKAKDEDFNAVHDVFLAGQGRFDYEPNLKLHGQHLTPFQRELYLATADVFRKTLEESNKFLSSMGKKVEITQKLGYLPSVRRGDYAVVVRGGSDYTRGFNEDGTPNYSNVVRIERFFTIMEANTFVKEFKKSNPEGMTVDILEKQDTPASPYQYEIMMNLKEALEEAGAPQHMLAKVQTRIEELISRGGTIGSHHKHQMGFIEGGKGTELFYSKADRAKSFRDGVVEYVKEVTKQIEKQAITTKLDLILTNPALASNKNLLDFVNGMRDHAVAPDTSGVSKDIKVIVDHIWTGLHRAVGDKNYHPDHHVYDGAMGKVTHAFYLKFLMSRPAFWAAQAMAFTVGFRSLVYNQGLIGATADIGTGLKYLFNNDKDFRAFVHWVVENRGTFQPQFITDLKHYGLFDSTSAGFQKVIGVLTGETQSTATDSFSRLITASYMFAHHKKMGLTGEDLYKKVAFDTDKNMVLYGQTYKAPMYQQMGILGDLISPLATYPHAQIMNLATDFKYMKDKKTFMSTLPLITTVFTSAVAGGVIGMVGAAEIELLIRSVNFLLRYHDIDYQFPTLFDLANGDYTGIGPIDRTISHGFTTALTEPFSEEGGYDIGSPNRWRSIGADIVAGEKNFLESIPVISWLIELPGAIKTTANPNATPGEKRDAINQLPIPAWSLGFIDAAKFDSYGEGVVPTRKNDPVVNKSPERANARFLGSQTVEEHRVKYRKFQNDKQKRTLLEERGKLIDRIAAGTYSPEETMDKIIKLAKIYKMDPAEVFDAIFNKSIKQNISYEDFPTGKEFSLPTPLEQEVYGE